jgi:hypothetical protein
MDADRDKTSGCRYYAVSYVKINVTQSNIQQHFRNIVKASHHAANEQNFTTRN